MYAGLTVGPDAMVTPPAAKVFLGSPNFTTLFPSLPTGMKKSLSGAKS